MIPSADLAVLDTPQARQRVMRGRVEDWASESLLAARKPYTLPETGERLKSGQKLSEPHLNANVPVARRPFYRLESGWP